MKIRLRDRVNPKDPVGAALASYDVARQPELNWQADTLLEDKPQTHASPEGQRAIDLALSPSTATGRPENGIHDQIVELNARLARLESGDPLSDLASTAQPEPTSRRPFLEQYAARRPGAR